MTTADARPLEPLLVADPMVRDAAERAFADLAERWFRPGGEAPPAPALVRRSLLDSVVDLGFAEALPSPGDPEGWPDAAVIIRAQARSATPVDMAVLLVTGDREAAIAEDPGQYRCGQSHVLPTEATARSALALGRCLQICGAMDAALALSLRYVQDRRQFGRPLSAFQAIQHSLAIAAEEAAATSAATDLAVACMAREGGTSARLPALIDAASLVAGHAVDVVYDACHQVHGAIGFTREYALHRHTLDLLRWRDHLQVLRGGELASAERLGDAVLQASGVWRAVTGLMNFGDAHD